MPIAGRGLAAIVHGAVAASAPADELDVLHQVDSIGRALRSAGWTVAVVPASLDLADLADRLEALRPAVVVNLVESLAGRGQLLSLAASLFEAGGLTFTGNGADALYLTGNKLLAKRLMVAHGLPTPAWLEPAALLRGAAVEEPCIVKSVWEHASIGMDATSVARGPALTAVARDRRRRFGGAWFAERFVEGREFNLSLLDDGDGRPVLLPPAEIRFDGFAPGRPRIVDYRAKWDEASFEARHTVRCFPDSAAEPALFAGLARLALACWDVFGLTGCARVDFRVDGGGTPWILEVNANPGLAPEAGFAAAAARAGLGFEALIGRLVDAARRRC